MLPTTRARLGVLFAVDESPFFRLFHAVEHKDHFHVFIIEKTVLVIELPFLGLETENHGIFFRVLLDDAVRIGGFGFLGMFLQFQSRIVHCLSIGPLGLCYRLMPADKCRIESCWPRRLIKRCHLRQNTSRIHSCLH